MKVAGVAVDATSVLKTLLYLRGMQVVLYNLMRALDMSSLLKVG